MTKPTRAQTKRIKRSKRERFMPFRFEAHALTAECTRVWIDDQELDRVAESDDEGAKIPLPKRWSKLRLQVCIKSDDGLLDRVLPEHERQTPLARWLLRVDAPDTRLRRAETAIWHSSDCQLSLSLHAEDVGGPVTLTPWLVRSHAGHPVAGYASEEGQRLATGRSITLFPPEPSVAAGHFLDVRYKSFRGDPVLSRSPSSLYFLEVNGDQPVLFINADHAGLGPILDSKGQRGSRARLREVCYDLISVGVWTQLFFQSVEALDEEGNVPRSWQAGVLAELLPFVFPAERNHSLRIVQLLAIRSSGGGLSQLSQLCDQALQARSNMAKHLLSLVSEIGPS